MVTRWSSARLGELDPSGETSGSIVGDVQVLDFFFKSEDAAEGEQPHLLGAQVLNAASGSANDAGPANRMPIATGLDPDHDWINDDLQPPRGLT